MNGNRSMPLGVQLFHRVQPGQKKLPEVFFQALPRPVDTELLAYDWLGHLPVGIA